MNKSKKLMAIKVPIYIIALLHKQRKNKGVMIEHFINKAIEEKFEREKENLCGLKRRSWKQ